MKGEYKIDCISENKREALLGVFGYGSRKY